MGLFAWLGAAFATVFAWIAEVVGKKLGIALAAISGWLLLAGTFTAAINTIANGLIQAAPPGGNFMAGLSLLPGNVGQCIAAIVSSYGAAWVYRAQTKAIEFKAQA